jgi:hypothetical protein
MYKNLNLDHLHSFSYFLCHCYKERGKAHALSQPVPCKEKSRKNNASALQAHAHPAVFSGLLSWNIYFIFN